MKQSPFAPLTATTPMAIRFSYNGGGAGGGTTVPTSGLTYVLQPQGQGQQKGQPGGMLRPVSFMTQQQNQQVNGGAGGPVVIRRFPNNNLVQVRRIVNQQQVQVQKVAAAQQFGASSNGTVVVSSVSKQQQQPQLVVKPAVGQEEAMSSSEVESDEFEEGRGTGVRSNGCFNGRGGEGKEQTGGTNQLTTLKRKMVNEEEEEEDDEEGRLVIDEDEEDQDGDVIEDVEEGEEKSALELNEAGVDTGFLRHVIETQILNRHKARIKDWDGTRGHMCQSCHESFLSEAGLETHRNRKIHHIFFFCRSCKRDLSFFNKCRLLQHLRNHRVTPTVNSLQNCVMIRLLPESDYLHFKYEDCTSSSEDDDGDAGVGSRSPINCGGGAGGASSSTSNGGGSSPPKRLKPSRFRRIARSSVTGRDSDNSPPPNVSRQIVQPPQQLLSPPVNAEKSTTSIVSTLNSSAAAAVNQDEGTSTATPIKIIGNIASSSSQADGTAMDGSAQQPKASQVAVIKSTGNTSSVLIPSSKPEAKDNTVNTSTETSDKDSPQIRIRNLSQITVSVNDGEEDDATDNPDKFEEEGREEPDKLQIQPVVIQVTTATSTTATDRVQMQQAATSQLIVGKQQEYSCYKCDKHFRTCAEFFKHLVEAEQVGLKSRSLHRCPTDDIPSWSQCQYVFHTKVFHEKTAPFMCPGCGEESQDYNGLLEHVTNDCFYLSQRARYMCAAGAVSKCSFADRKSVKTEPEIIDHLKKEHSRSVLQCLHCTQGFATDNWLLKHLAETHGVKFDESKSAGERESLIAKTTRPLTQCLICNILFPNGPTYLQHVYLNFHMHIHHAKMLECQNCLVVFETHEELFSHRQSNEPCHRLDPFSMKISEANDEEETVNNHPQPQLKQQSQPTSTTIVTSSGTIVKVQQNPVVTGKSIVQSSQSPLTVISSIASTTTTSSSLPPALIPCSSNGNVKPPRLSPQVPMNPSRSQVSPTKVNNTQSQNPSSLSPLCRALPSIAPKGKMGLSPKKTIFDELLSCQFCERLVVFSSLRKHEDQCCGLSTVDPGYCLTCKQYFGDKTRLALHGIQHLQEGIPICLYCNNRHIRPTHPKSTTPSNHENLYALKKHLYSNHTSKIVNFPWKCTLCSSWMPDKRATEFHIKDHQFKYHVPGGNQNDQGPPSPVEVSQEELQKMVRVRRKGVDPKRKVVQKTIQVYYCPVCKNREFGMEAGLARHLKLVHQKNPKNVNMNLLKKTSTARRFVVKAPDTGNAPGILVMQTGSPQPPQQHQQKQPSQQQQQTSKPILRSVAGGRATNNSSSSPTSTPSTPQKAPVTVSGGSSANSFTSRFSSSIVLRKRLTPTSSTSPVLRKPSSNFPPRPLPNTRQRTSSTTSTTSSPSTNSRPATTTRPPSNFLQTRASSAAASKSCRKKDGTISCLQCADFSCKTELEFCEHVKWKHIWPEAELQKLRYGNKLEDPSEYWCPECDTTFVAKPSLVRHLKFAHDYIKSTEEYMQRIGYEGKKPVKPNQCEVCYFQCQDDRELQQHMRTHGMAFLRLRQQRQMSLTNNSSSNANTK